MRRLNKRRLDAATANSDAAVFEHEVAELNVSSDSAHVTLKHLYNTVTCEASALRSGWSHIVPFTVVAAKCYIIG